MKPQSRNALFLLTTVTVVILAGFPLLSAPFLLAQSGRDFSKTLAEESVSTTALTEHNPANSESEPILQMVGSTISVTVSVTNLITGDESLLPDRFSLYQNYPNPFNSSTIIQYTLPEAVWVRMEVYDILGRRVATLVDGYQQPGYYSYNWEATNEATGVYFYRITAGQFQKYRKMLILK